MDKFFSDIKSTAKNAAKKSGDLLEMGKLKFAVMEIQGKIDDAFKELGKFIYESEKNGEVDGDVNAMIEEIDALFKTLDERSEQSAALKNEKKCKLCGEINREKAIFCSNCGEKFGE